MEQKTERHEWFTAARFSALLALLIFLFFPDVALGTRTFIFRDYGLYVYPVAQGWMPFVVLAAQRASGGGWRLPTVAGRMRTFQRLTRPPEGVVVTWLVRGALWRGQCVFGKLPVGGSLKRFLLDVLAIT